MNNEQQFADAVVLEANRALTMFGPQTTSRLLAALMEEVGEVSEAYLEEHHRDQFQKECVQVAAMAMRLAMQYGSMDY